MFNEPLGSFLVFLLAFLWIIVGIYFLKTANTHRSRLWFGVALLLGGVGAAQAGISYQAFSYALKCAGRELCQLTNGFEVGYSMTQAASVGAMLIAAAYAAASGGLRAALIIFSVINVLLYLVVAIAGMALPNRVLLSFEVLMLFALPGIVIVVVLTLRGSGLAARTLLRAALLLLLVQVAYFTYAATAITPWLWHDGRGFYFSENDVLHVGMIAWLGYAYATLGERLVDCS